ncbi:13278_t:CDS:2, partial [Acaulospora colombiana]
MAAGASALAVLHAVGRDVSTGTSHRRYAPVVVGRSGDSSPAPNIQARQLMAQRRALRQKRCAPRVPGSGDNSLAPSETTSSVSTEATEVPVNVAPAPSPSDNNNNNVNNETPAPAPSDTTPAPSNGNSGDTFTGELTYYDVGLGACGRTNNNGEMVAAAS